MKYIYNLSELNQLIKDYHQNNIDTRKLLHINNNLLLDNENIKFSLFDIYKFIKTYNRKNNTNIDISKLLKFDNDDLYLSNRLNTQPIENPNIIYEDENIYGIYKPAFWIVQVCEGGSPQCDINCPENKHKSLLQMWLNKNLDYELKNSNENQYGICNRLDVETSGVIIVAKTLKIFEGIREIINSHKNTKKKYYALVKGHITNEMIVDANLECKYIHKCQKCFISTNKEAKYAKSKFKIRRYYQDENGVDYTLLKVRIYTGRTHQIRVHTSLLNTYVIGDSIYTQDKETFIQEQKLISRLFLHAFYYSFYVDNKKIVIRSKLPDELVKVLKKLKHIKDDKIDK